MANGSGVFDPKSRHSTKMVGQQDDDFAYSQALFGNDEVLNEYLLVEELHGTLEDNGLLFATTRFGENAGISRHEIMVDPNTMQIIPGTSQQVNGGNQKVRLTDSDLDQEFSPALLPQVGSGESLSLNTKDLLQDVVPYELPLPRRVQPGASSGNGSEAGGLGKFVYVAGDGFGEGDVAAESGSNDFRIPNDECIVFDNWVGEYNFKVSPLLDSDSGNRKPKIMYSQELQKLFCNTGTAVPFKFEMEYDRMINLDQFMIRAFLVYEDNDAVNKPVLRCSTDMNKERNITDASKMDRLVHMMRYTDAGSDMMYYQNAQSKRCYILVPLKEPEPGMNYVTRSYSFTCRNSCSVLELDGKSRKAISIMFCLYDLETGRVCGRSHTHVRICSAPHRDYAKECLKSTPGAVNRKRQSDEIDENALPSPKQLNLGSREIEIGNVVEVPLQGQHQVPETVPTIRNSVRAPIKSDDDGVSSSQETVASFNEEPTRIQLRSLVKDIRWVLKLKESSDPELRACANNVYTTLKLTQQMCTRARERERELKVIVEEETSPDGGYGDDVQDLQE